MRRANRSSLLLAGIEAAKAMRKCAQAYHGERVAKRDILTKGYQVCFVINIANLGTFIQYVEAIIRVVDDITAINRKYSLNPLCTYNEGGMRRYQRGEYVANVLSPDIAVQAE